MADDGQERFALGRLILDYLRTFLWPLVLVSIILIYKNDVLDLLKSREFEVAGVFKIGKQVEQIEKHASEEIADIRALLEAQRDRSGTEAAAVTSDIETKLTRLEDNLSREVNLIRTLEPQVQQTQQVQSPPLAAQLEARADLQELERTGFRSLLDGDVDTALKAFETAYQRLPDYHNVREISEALREHRDELLNPSSDSWSKLYRKVLADFSWGMPKDLRAEFRARAAKAY